MIINLSDKRERKLLDGSGMPNLLDHFKQLDRALQVHEVDDTELFKMYLYLVSLLAHKNAGDIMEHATAIAEAGIERWVAEMVEMLRSN